MSQRDEGAHYYRQVLNELIAMGTDLAEAVHRQALAERAAAQTQPDQSQPEDQQAAPSLSLAQPITFDRLAHLTDGELWQHSTPPREQEGTQQSAQAGVPSRMCARAARPPVATPGSPRHGTGSPAR